MALLVEHPVNWAVFAPCWIALDVNLSTKVISDKGAKVICVVGRIHDDVADTRQAFDQPTRLRAVAPLARRDRAPDRQTERINSGMDFRRQTAFGPADTGSFKPPF